jgi:glyoxylase-like metal-dependent hydrolase (beta-lactamase superfamily II)
MQRLWGEVIPVPEANLHVLTGGETVLGDYRVEYTPGHASHHVAYLHEPSGTAICGDVAGVRIPPAELVLAPTPPPDVDVAAWERSVDLIRGWQPQRLCFTHCGDATDVDRHLDAVIASLHELADRVAETDLDTFVAGHVQWLAERTDEATAAAYLQAVPPDHVWLGLDRWRTKVAAT